MAKQTPGWSGSEEGSPSQVSEPEEATVPEAMPVDPTATAGDAVKTAADGRKVGWQQPPRPPSSPDPSRCAHTGSVFARLTLARHEIGDEWVCLCGQTFEVKIGGGGNKILARKEVVDE